MLLSRVAKQGGYGAGRKAILVWVVDFFRGGCRVGLPQPGQSDPLAATHLAGGVAACGDGHDPRDHGNPKGLANCHGNSNSLPDGFGNPDGFPNGFGNSNSLPDGFGIPDGFGLANGLANADSHPHFVTTHRHGAN